MPCIDLFLLMFLPLLPSNATTSAPTDGRDLYYSGASHSRCGRRADGAVSPFFLFLF